MKQTFTGIPEELVEEAKNNRWLRRRAPVLLAGGRDALPISHENKVVGFHVPAETLLTKKPTTGDMYISKEYRGKGLGTEALKDFIARNPEARFPESSGLRTGTKRPT